MEPRLTRRADSLICGPVGLHAADVILEGSDKLGFLGALRFRLMGIPESFTGFHRCSAAAGVQGFKRAFGEK